MISLTRSTANLTVLTSATPAEGERKSASHLVEGVRDPNPYGLLQRVSENVLASTSAVHVAVQVQSGTKAPSPEAKQQLEDSKAERQALQTKLAELQERIKDLQRQLKEESDKSWPFRSEDRIAELNAEIQRLAAEMKKLQQEMRDSQEETEKSMKALQDASSDAPDKQTFEAARHRESPLFLGLPYEFFRKAYVRETVD